MAANYSRASVHDPSIVKLQDGSYYIIGSHLGAARSNDLGNWTAAANSNLGSTNTTFFKNIYTDLAIPEKWSNTTNGYNLAGNMWAPDIIYNEAMGKYCINDTNYSNHAIAGRSSKSFYDNGRPDTILNQIQAGDYLLVQFGINDGAFNKAERHAPNCGTVPGTDGSFEFYIAKYIEGALAKGATPILITPPLSLKNRSGSSFVTSYTNYTDSVKKPSAYYKVPYIDLNGLMVDHYNQIGYDTAYTYHMCVTGSTDMTHFTETGANAVAGLVANAIKGLNLDISGRVTS